MKRHRLHILALASLLTFSACASVEDPNAGGDAEDTGLPDGDDTGGERDGELDADLEDADDTGPNNGTNNGGVNNGTNNGTNDGDDTGEDVVQEDVAPDVDDEADVSDDADADQGGDADVPPANEAPVAAVAENILGTVGATIAFDGASSYDPDGQIVGWAWDFGDGEVGEGERVDHVYGEVGTFHGALTVTDDEGAQGTATFMVQVFDPADNAPVAVIAIDPTPGRVGSPVRFSGASSLDPNGSIVAWSWQLGDGLGEPVVLAGREVSWTFDAPGTWQVALEVTDDEGLTGEAAAELRVGVPPVAVITAPMLPWVVGAPLTFDGATSSDADGQLVAWSWAFGDGQGAEGERVEHTFAANGLHTVTLTVTDDDGFTHMDSLDLDIGALNQAPVADAGPDVFADVGIVRFDGSRSRDPDGQIVSWDWDFGDGQTGTGATPAHTWNAGGVYTVTLTVTDDQGATDSDTLIATISAPNQAPTANAGPDLDVEVDQVVRFDGMGSDPDGTLVAWHWTFGDNQSADGQSVFHAWSSVGLYGVTLTVTDNGGAQASDSLLVNVTRPNRAPVASFTASPTPGIAGLPVRLDASGSIDPDGDAIVSWSWSFGDGSPNGSGQLVDHTWAAANTYNVTLVVTDARGAMGTTSGLLTVEQPAASYDGLYRVRPLDQEAPIDDLCGDFSVTIGPSTCNTTVTGGSVVMDCGDDVYRGTINGDTFRVTLDYNPVYVDALCGNAWWEETVDGAWVSQDRWEGTSNLSLRTTNPFWCGGCTYLPFVKTGTRL